ncbi:MAG: polysaccharide deacetylase family protein [Bacteroidetes bacterium]|nr:polysaccharide deacetylase family protein [Bacteroidota bacterium]
MFFERTYLLLFFLLFNIYQGPDTGSSSSKEIAERLQQVPVLCYHQVRDWDRNDSKSGKVYVTPVNTFKEHISMLHDNGYHSISPDQLLAYAVKGAPLPARPILICFDDGTLSQYKNAVPEMEKAGFKATFFIMTVVLNKPRYMTTAMLRTLASKGHTIGCHTWDHHAVTGYTDADWKEQLEKPTKQLENITGKHIIYFAYPNGQYSKKGFGMLKSRGYAAAFQLWGEVDKDELLFNIRRILVDGNWDSARLLKEINSRYYK